MAVMVFNTLPDLGVGIGFRPSFFDQLFQYRGAIDFLEITADHYFEASPSKRAELELLQRNFTLIPHGLAMSLGSAEGLDPKYLRLYADLVNRLDPPWCSEHIAFTRAGGIDIGHLTQVPKTDASLRVLKENIARLRSEIRVPLILENITDTLTYPNETYDNADFLCAVCEQNEVGLLLDVTNLFISSANYRWDPISFLRRLPKERIVQLHFVGGNLQDGMWIDSHSRKTQDAIWELLEEVIKIAPVKGMVLERDENIPMLGELVEELEYARGIVKRVR